MEACPEPTPPNGRFTFALQPEERKRIDTVIFVTSSPSWYWIPLSILWGCNFALTLVVHRSLILMVLNGFLFAFYSLSGLFRRFVAPRLRRIATGGSLVLSDAGFAGTLDGVATEIGWRDIASVRDLDTELVLVLRRYASAVAIPKRAIADVPALWALLEDRLIAKRGLILRPAPRRSIANSAY